MLPVLCVLKPNVHLPSLLFGAKFDLKQEIEYCLYARATLSFEVLMTIVWLVSVQSIKGFLVGKEGTSGF